MDSLEIEEPLHFGSYVKHYRKQYGMTQTYLSEESNVTRAVISAIELGKIKNPHLNTVLRITKALDIGLFLNFK